MVDPSKFTFQHWFQAYKDQFIYVSDFKASEYEEAVLPKFFFLTTPGWKKLYEDRGKILGVKIF